MLIRLPLTCSVQEEKYFPDIAFHQILQDRGRSCAQDSQSKEINCISSDVTIKCNGYYYTSFSASRLMKERHLEIKGVRPGFLQKKKSEWVYCTEIEEIKL